MYASLYTHLNPLSTRPHQNVVWYNNFLIRFSKNSELCTKRKRKYTAKNEPSFVSLNVAIAHRNYLGRNNL